MAAGLGFKTFNAGDVLSAADTNGYLMQGVLVFANATARDAAITSPQEGQFAFTKDNDSLWYYSGSAWVSSGATGDIEGVTAGTGISGGGTSGTVTVTNSMATAIDAKGDLIVGTGADTFSRLAVGTNNYVLTADSAEATGLKWAAAAGGGGKVLQVVSASTTTKTTITSTSYTDVTNLTATITPSAATSKILVLITANALTTGTSTAFVASSAQIVRGATAIMTQQSVQSSDGASATDLSNGNMVALTYLDSPSTTSATTYKLQAKKRNGVNVIYNWDSGADTNNSTITLMEIGA